MKLNFTVQLASIFLVVALTSCVSMTTMQTGRTSERGEFTIGGGGGVISATVPLSQGNELKQSAPFLEAGARYGITDKIDAGLKFTLIGSTVLDGKYQFIGDHESKIAGSVGLAFGYLSTTLNDYENTLVDVMIPLYFSYHPIDWFAVYASPKYALRNIFYNSSVASDNGIAQSNWFGTTGGIRIGKKVAFLAEYTNFQNLGYSVPFSQVTFGFTYSFK